MKFADPAAVAEGFRDAWNRASAVDLTAVFTADADFINMVGFWWRGHRQIEHNHAIGFRDMFPDTDLEFERTSVRRLGEDHAVVHARWRITGQVVPDGSAEQGVSAKRDGTAERGGVRRGVLSFVVSRHSDGGWLAVAAHNIDILPGAQTHLVEADGGVAPTRYPR